MSQKSNRAIPNENNKQNQSLENFNHPGFSKESFEKDNQKIVYKLNRSDSNQINLTLSNKQKDIEQYNFLLSLPDLAQIALYCLAINYINLSLVELENHLIDYWNQPSDVAEILIELQKKDLIIKNEENWQFKKEEFKLFVLAQLLGNICEEIEYGKLYWVNILPLLQASSYEYIKEQQINNHIKPIINFLQGKFSKEEIIRKLKSIIEIHRNTPYQENFAIGNILNLLIHLNNGLIENQNFSEMSVWETDLINVQLHNVQFSRSDLSGSNFLQRHLGMILSIDVSPNGEYIATGDNEGYVRVFDVETGKEVYSLRRDNYWALVWVVRFDPTGQIIACAGDDHRITLWQFEDSDEQLTLGTGKEHNDSIRTIVFVDKNTLISGSGDHTIRYWDISNSRNLLEQNQLDIASECETQSFEQIHSNSVRSLSVSKDRNYIVSGGSDGKLVLWKKKLNTSINTSNVWEKYENDEYQEYEKEINWGKVRGVAFYPNENSCFVALYDSGIAIFKDFKLFKKFQFTDKPNEDNDLERWVLCLAVDPTGKWLATGDEKGYVKLWKLDLIVENNEINSPEYEFKAHDNRIRSLAFIDEQRFVTGSINHSVKTWNIISQNSSTSIQNLRKIKSYSNWIWSLIYSHDGEYLISSHGDSKIRVWKNDNFDLPIQVLEGHSSIPRTMTLTCDSNVLATGSCDCLIKLWDTKQIFSDSPDIQSKNLKGHKSWIRCVRSHPTIPHIIASCGDDTTIRLWNIRTQKHRILGEDFNEEEVLKKKQDVKRHTDPVRTICFSDDGQYIASGGGDKKIIVWKLKENTDLDLPEYEFFDSQPYIDKQSRSEEWVWSIAFILDQIVAVGGGSQEAAVFKVTENSVESSYDSEYNLLAFENKTPSRILKYHSKTQCIASGGTDHKIEFWRNAQRYISKGVQAKTIRAMAFSPDGKILATGGQDEHLYLWNVEDGTLLSRKLLVDSPYVNVKLDLVSGLSPEEIENISKLIGDKNL